MHHWIILALLGACCVGYTCASLVDLLKSPPGGTWLKSTALKLKKPAALPGSVKVEPGVVESKD